MLASQPVTARSFSNLPNEFLRSRLKYPTALVGALQPSSRVQLGLQHAHEPQSRYPARPAVCCAGPCCAVGLQRPLHRLVREAPHRKTTPAARWKYVRNLRPIRRSLIILHASFSVAPSPADALALTNCLIVHPQDFPPGQHVHVNGQFALTVK